jgi:EAL domain-containing protein (putative c-di-GMP-specific phosphodiesterase class I)/GGDEF domain-containing protein
MKQRPVYQSHLFRQILQSVSLVMLLVLLVLGFLLQQTIQNSIQEQAALVKENILSLAGDQVKRSLLIEDISQLNSFSKQIVENERNSVIQVKVFIEGETKPLAVYPSLIDTNSQCRLDSLSVVINDMPIGRLDVCFNEIGLSESLQGLTSALFVIMFLGFVGLLILILKVVTQHIERIDIISKAIKRYTKGDENVQVHVKNSNELGSLEQFFNEMVSKVSLSQEETRHMAFYDPLTDLPNKLKLIEDLPDRKQAFAVNIFIIEDYDHIEQVFGEVYTNQVIHSFVRRLNRHFIDGVIYHVTSDVFIVLGRQLTEEMVAYLTGKLTIGFNDHHEINLSVKGVSFNCVPEHGLDVAKMVLRMVRHTKNKPITFMHLDDNAFKRILKGYLIAENLLKGKTEGLQVYAQVIYPIQSGEWPHIELLVRYQDQEHGLLTPYFFLDQVIELGGIDALDRFMMRQAEALLARHVEHKMMVFINLTPATLFSRHFKEWIHEQHSNTDLQKRMVFEVNEGFFIEMGDESTQMFKEINNAGFKLALDDFGSGFSSYNWLSQLPISYLKIDRSLIVVEGHKADTVLASISSMANDLGVVTIVEGVETEAQYQRIVKHGFNQIQGFYLDIPGPVEEKVEKILNMELK